MQLVKLVMIEMLQLVVFDAFASNGFDAKSWCLVVVKISFLGQGHVLENKIFRGHRF